MQVLYERVRFLMSSELIKSLINLSSVATKEKLTSFSEFVILLLLQTNRIPPSRQEMKVLRELRGVTDREEDGKSGSGS